MGQSAAMSINDGQIRIIESKFGEVIFIDIDLHFKDGEKMYFVAMQNDQDHKHQMGWQITSFLTKQHVFSLFPDVTEDYLPKSSRKMADFLKGLTFVPINVPSKVFECINVYKLPKKYPKKGVQQKRMSISVRDFLFCISQTI